MSKQTSIILTERFEEFVAHEIATGRYGSESEVVAAGLELLAQEEAKLEALRAAIDEGLKSGEPVDGMAAFAEVRHELGLALLGF